MSTAIFWIGKNEKQTNKETECDDETSLWHWNQQQCHQKKPKVEGGKEKRVKTIRILFILFLLCFVWAFEKRAFEHTLFTWNEQKHTQKLTLTKVILLLVCVKFIMKWIFNVLNHMQIWNKKTKKNVKFSNGMQNIDVVLKQHDHENKKTKNKQKLIYLWVFEILKNWVSWFVIQRWEPLIFSFSYHHQKSLFQFLFYFYSVTMRA